MEDFLTNPIEICFGSISATFTAPAAIAPSTATPTKQVDDIHLATPVADLLEKIHPPAPFDLVAGDGSCHRHDDRVAPNQRASSSTPLGQPQVHPVHISG